MTLREMIYRKRYSIKYFCEQIGITRRTFYNWEQGITRPKRKDLENIASEFMIEVEELIENLEEKEEK